MAEIIKTYTLGDMSAVYLLNPENHNPELVLLPEGTEYRDRKRDKPYPDSLVQVKIAGDIYPGGYAGGRTMRQSQTVERFKYIGQTVTENEDGLTIRTTLKDDRNYRIENYLTYRNGEKAVRSYNVFINDGSETALLELLSSFSLGKISPFMEGIGFDTIKMHRIRSVWCMEGRLETHSLEDLQLEPSGGGHAVRAERFGQCGSLPVNGFFPTAVIEDTGSGLFWGVQIAHNASWQIEVYRRGDDVQISGGLADREFGHWMKNIAPGESFKTPEAILSVCKSEDREVIFQRLTSALEKDVDRAPASEQSLPIVFNEYCTTWGSPSHDNIAEIVDAIKGRGIEYFVIDCGWFRRKDVPWHVSMGDYEVSEDLFPDGLRKTVDLIKANGMKPGIWFEIDNIGSEAKVYHLTEHHLKRDGYPLTTDMRRYWDMRQPWVKDYLRERVIGTLNKYGFEYMKMDYNDTVGIGCDGAESLGEGLRQNMEESLAFIREVKEKVPEIILENCSSGGHKLEPLMMSECSMASFSDAHEGVEIPVIAANLHRVILPRQSQIWAVIRQTDSLKRIAYSIAATFLGRMCLSGDVWRLDEAQWKVIDDGMAFYRKIAPIIKKGFTSFYGTRQTSWRNLKGWQGILRKSEDGKAVAIFHGFNENRGTEIKIPIPAGYVIKDIYSYKQEEVSIADGMLSLTMDEDMKAVAVYLEK